MIKIIQEYAMICPEVKFNVLNQDKKGYAILFFNI